MSSENQELARRICEAAWRRPEPDYGTIAELGHPGHRMCTIQTLVEGGEGYTGAEGFREWLASWNEMFGEDWVSTVLSTESVGPEHVLVSGEMSARGAQGGVPIHQRFWVIMHIRAGKAVRSEVHTDRERALEGVGDAGQAVANPHQGAAEA